MLQAKLFIIWNQDFMQTDARVEGSNPFKSKEAMASFDMLAAAEAEWRERTRGKATYARCPMIFARNGSSNTSSSIGIATPIICLVPLAGSHEKALRVWSRTRGTEASTAFEPPTVGKDKDDKLRMAGGSAVFQKRN